MIRDQQVGAPCAQSPVPIERPTAAQVDWAMSVLASIFQMDLDQYNHLEWLMSTGLIRPSEGRAVVEALGYEPIGPGLHSPTDRLEQAPSVSGSISCMLPDVRPELPPPPGMQTFTSLPALPPMPRVSQALVPVPVPPTATQHFDISSTSGSELLPLRDLPSRDQPAPRN